MSKNFEELKGGDIILIKSPVDGEEVLAILTASRSTPAGQIEKVLTAFESDDVSQPEYSFDVSHDFYRNNFKDWIGNYMDFFAQNDADYKLILKNAGRQIGPLTMARAIKQIQTPGTPTTEDSIRRIVADAVQKGERRVNILREKVESALAAIKSA